MAIAAGIDTAGGEFAQRVDRAADPSLGQRDGAARQNVDLFLALTFDQPAQPKIERRNRRAR